MVKRRALEKSDELAITEKLPLFYKSVSPLTPEKHGDLHLATERDFQFAATANAIPLTCDEFSQALKHYPIVIADAGEPIPVALVGLKKGVNDHVDKNGAWKAGHYVPAFLRRYPFLLLRESKSAERAVLCADMTSTLISKSDGNRFFHENGSTSKTLEGVLDFCMRYDSAAARTKQVMTEAKELGLIQASTVNLTRGDTKARVEGFSMIAEDKVRALHDAKLADLAKRGLLTIFAAHHLSMSNFSDFGAL